MRDIYRYIYLFVVKQATKASYSQYKLESYCGTFNERENFHALNGVFSYVLIYGYGNIAIEMA